MENIKIMKITVPKPVIVCIGTPRVQGDSLGPKVGDLLIKRYNVNAYVYGKTSSPITGVNCERYFEHIKTHHSHSLVIAVDACLGKKNDVGTIKYSFDGLRAGSALNKKLGKIGNIGLLGIVAPSGKNNMDSLLRTTSDSIDTLASEIAKKIERLLADLRLTYNF